MIKEGIIIDTVKNRVERECTYDDKRVDDIYVKVDNKDLIPAAYVFPRKNREHVEIQLARIAKAKKEYEDIQSEVFYKAFPSLR